MSTYPANYLLFNQQLSKNLALVMQIEGIDDLYGISDTFTTVRYGDPGIVYGLPGLVYGGLRKVSGINGTGSVKPYIVLDGSMVIAQRIEPEQGKGNLGTITMTLIDKNGEISRIIAPGIVVDEIMVTKEVKLFLGFAQTSFPEDYLLIYRGYITSLDCPPGLVKFQISDSTTKKRQPIFNTPNTNLDSSIDAVVTVIPVLNTLGFHQQILGPDGNYDPEVRTFIKIDDEIMEYGPAGISSPTQFTVTRAALGTVAAAHDADASVSNSIILGNTVTGINAITLTLKLMLSGWNGPCETGIALLSFVYTYDVTLGFVSNVFVLLTVDAESTLGLTIGDYFTVSGATNPGNNVSGVITDIVLLNSKFQIIYTDQTFTLENPTTAVASFRSKYDTLPITAGAKCRMRDVDVAGYEMIRSTYFTTATFSNMSFLYDESKMAKDVIDTDIMLPLGAYSISRFGRMSMSVTKPPLPGIGKLVTLDWTNVLDPDKIHVTRSSNSRTFYNLVSYEYDKDYATAAYGSLQQFLDLASLNQFDQVSKLPIQAPGLRTALGGATLAQSRGQALLNRYKKVALMLELTVNWSAGSLIEVSDIVLLRDDGHLKIMNFDTGERNLGSQMFEVIDRSYNVTAGNVKLKLLGGLGFNVDSRFGLFSPSSIIGSSSTSTDIKITPSFGQTSIVNELAKWTPYIGLPVQVHSEDWSVTGQGVILTTSGDTVFLDPASGFAFAPSAGMILEISSYPLSTSKTEQQIYKNLYAHVSPSIPVVTGSSTTVFTVSPSDVTKMTVGNTVIVRKNDYSAVSPEIAITDITGVTVTVASTLGFTPDNTYTVEGIGWPDGLSFYRYG